MIIISLALSVLPLISCFPLEVFRAGEISSRYYVNSKTYLWPLINGAIYYDVDPELHIHDEMKSTVEEAVDYMNEHTCVKWVQRLPWDYGVKDYVVFHVARDTAEYPQCYTFLGYRANRGKHYIYLGEFCYLGYKHDFGEKSIYRIPLHEMMHRLGFVHEHQRPDRDCYIDINIIILLDLKTRTRWWPEIDVELTFDQFPYDYHSIMHYQDDEYVHAYNASIGTKLGVYDGTMSELDIWQIATVYCGEPTYCQKNQEHCTQIQEEKAKNPNCTRYNYDRSNWNWD